MDLHLYQFLSVCPVVLGVACLGVFLVRRRLWTSSVAREGKLATSELMSFLFAH